MRVLPILVFLLVSNVSAIELVIGGKTYYIEKYHIKENGQKIEIPYTIHLEPQAFENKNCNTAKTSSVVIEGNRKPASSGFGDLMKSVEGGFQNLKKSIGGPKKSKRNYR